MAVRRGTATPSKVYRGTVPVKKIMRGTVEVWSAVLPVVTITGTSGTVSRDQFRAACTQYGVNYQTVQELPFLLDTSQATNLTQMFYGCSALTTVPDMDTSNVTNMSAMFYNCTALATVPDMDTSNVTDMTYMFSSCSALTTVPDMNTSQVTDMAFMFNDCSLLTTVPDLKTSQVTEMDGTFYNCSSLTDGNVRCIGKHPSVTTDSMIQDSGLTREPFYDTNGNPLMTTVQITGTVEGESSEQLNQALATYGLDRFTITTLPFLLDTSQATELKYLFSRCSALTTVPDMDTSQVTNMNGVFDSCSSLTAIPDMDTSQVTNMDNMFAGCSSLTIVPDMNTSQVTSMRYTFSNCSALASVPDLKTSQVTEMDGMFYNCSSLTDGNVRCIGKHPSVTTDSMIQDSGLTREPFLGAEGTITGRTLTNNSLTTLATRTIPAAEGGNLKLLRMTLAWGNATATKSIRIDRNGVQVATATGQNPIATTEVVCNIGDVITYKATVNSSTTANRVINSGTWGAWTR